MFTGIKESIFLVIKSAHYILPELRIRKYHNNFMPLTGGHVHFLKFLSYNPHWQLYPWPAGDNGC
jgi:hypothetical protein